MEILTATPHVSKGQHGTKQIGIDYRDTLDEPGELYERFASAVAELRRTDD